MRIAFVSHNISRGQGQALVNLQTILGCLRHNWEVTLIADEVDQELLDRGAAWLKACPKFRRPMLGRVCEFGWRANHIVERIRGDVDLIVGTGYSLSVPHDVNISHFVHSAWRRVSRTIHENSAWWQRANRHAYTLANCHLERLAYRQSRIVIAISNLVRDELVCIGVDPERIRVIPNGVDLSLFKTDRAERFELGLPIDVPLAVFVGDIRTQRKNLETVLHAIEQVAGLHLAVVGDTTRSAYPQLVVDRGLQSRVHFLGYRRDIPAIMSTADFLVFPSRYEPFGLVVLEAMAAGLPVLTCESTGAADLVSRAGGAVIKNANDIGSCAAVMRQWSQRPELRRELGRRARHVAESCSWEAMQHQYIQLFEQAAESISLMPVVPASQPC
jgi:glycosyltransferase involved in cell wall biosynthesis